MDDKITLGYWKIRGLGARVRLILEYVGLKYDEVYYTHENKDKWWVEEKKQFQKKNSAATMPYIIDGDKLICESDACTVYAIYKAGKEELMGRNPEEQVNLATVVGVFKDLYRTYLDFAYGKHEQSLEELKVIFVEKFEPALQKLSAILGEREYFAGDITYADFYVAELTEQLNQLDSVQFETKKNLLEHQKRIWELPSIKAYLESDRWIQSPINYVYARWGL